MTRPLTRAAAVTVWEIESLKILTRVRQELDRVERHVRLHNTGAALERAVEDAWDASSFVSRVMFGPETSEQELAERDMSFNVQHGDVQ